MSCLCEPIIMHPDLFIKDLPNQFFDSIRLFHSCSPGSNRREHFEGNSPGI